jgi:hypothetical protein
VETSIFVPDPFLAWLWKQFIRGMATSVAIGIIALVASIVFRAIALMVDTLHGALHEVLLLCISLNHTYMQSGPAGQFLIAVTSLTFLLWVIYRGSCFLYQSWRARNESTH